MYDIFLLCSACPRAFEYSTTFSSLIFKHASQYFRLVFGNTPALTCDLRIDFE